MAAASVTGPAYGWKAPSPSLYSVVAPASVASVSVGSLVYQPFAPFGPPEQRGGRHRGLGVAAPMRKKSKSTSIGAACAGPMAIRPIAGLVRATVTLPGDWTQVVPSALIAPV